jgi:hypothetical protein
VVVRDVAGAYALADDPSGNAQPDAQGAPDTI